MDTSFRVTEMREAEEEKFHGDGTHPTLQAGPAELLQQPANKDTGLSENLPDSRTHLLSSQDLQAQENRVSNLSGAVFQPASHIIVLEVDSRFYPLPDQESVIIGRRSTAHGQYALDVDLSFFNGLGHGVSRQHLTITRKNTLVYIYDMNTTNGTWLNGQKLTPMSERLLRDGDQLRLGQLKVRVQFR